jgi:hypothetical protein
MTGFLLKFIIIVLVIGAVYFGVRRIWRDWTGQFRDLDRRTHERDIKERERADVITLERDKDGTFRPPERRDR